MTFATYRQDENLGGVFICNASACQVHQCQYYQPHPDTVDTEREACAHYGIELDFTGAQHPSTCHSPQAHTEALTEYHRQQAIS